MFDALKRYADFQGRSRRKEFWLFYLLYMIVLTIGYSLVIAGAAGSAAVSYDADGLPVAAAAPQMGGLALLGSAIVGIWVLVTIIPYLAVTIRRMHDQDKSGWWMFVPVANFIFLFIEGTRGPNRFGADPKGN